MSADPVTDFLNQYALPQSTTAGHPLLTRQAADKRFLADFLEWVDTHIHGEDPLSEENYADIVTEFYHQAGIE